MATYVTQGQSTPTHRSTGISATGVTVYSLASAADGVALTGTDDMIQIVSDEAGWLHVGTTAADKAGSAKSHRVMADTRLDLGGVGAGLYISFLADAA